MIEYIPSKRSCSAKILKWNANVNIFIFFADADIFIISIFRFNTFYLAHTTFWSRVIFHFKNKINGQWALSIYSYCVPYKIFFRLRIECMLKCIRSFSFPRKMSVFLFRLVLFSTLQFTNVYISVNLVYHFAPCFTLNQRIYHHCVIIVH